ncbi:hypothetical protein J3A98_003330 [Pseudomonas sp. BP6]|nr:hypothetical protein [Pseudomonas sp. BP6]MBP2288392.1 hypothetical protein [Pseudomonas sp. BP7]
MWRRARRSGFIREAGDTISDPIHDENLLIHRLFHFPFP